MKKLSGVQLAVLAVGVLLLVYLWRARGSSTPTAEPDLDAEETDAFADEVGQYEQAEEELMPVFPIGGFYEPGRQPRNPGGHTVKHTPAHNQTRHDEVLRTVTFNARTPTHANLVRLAKRTKRPHVIAIQEGRGWHGTIPGYRRHGVAADGDTVFLVREDVNVAKTGHLSTGGGDYDFHGHTQHEKTIPTLRVRLGTQVYRLADYHGSTRTPGGADNRRAEHLALRGWFARSDLPSIVLGDWNAGTGVLHELASAVNGRFHLHAPDGALFRGVRVAKTRRLRSKFGSDHHRPIVYEFHAH